MPKNEFICDCHPIDVELVAKTKSVMLKDETIKSIAYFFSVVGDGTRCKILFALKENPMCVCDLANVLSMTKSSISHQLNKLKTAGFVKCEKMGKQVFYSLDDDHVCEIFDVSLKHLEHKAKETNNEK
ncbi:MAG: winged helix-turn-helix transcriptional regulator [Oscillospiraceae bacterium]|nr:winged helix-turn-helix transcriptional regulator [Oscillospiraceae bacterium]